MAAHPGLCPAHAPDRHLLPCPEQSGKEHECGRDASISQASHSPAVRTLWRTKAVGNVHRSGDDQPSQAAEEPISMCLINAQWLFSCVNSLFYLPSVA